MFAQMANQLIETPLPLRCLLVSPAIPVTYWGLQESLHVIGKAACQPPLGLITLAAELPSSWELRLVDLNVSALDPADLDWADTVFIGGMLIQAPSTRCRQSAAAASQPGSASCQRQPATPSCRACRFRATTY